MSISECAPQREETDNLEFVAEDVETLLELVQTLRMCANYYERRWGLGWRLAEPVQNGIVHLEKD